MGGSKTEALPPHQYHQELQAAIPEEGNDDEEEVLAVSQYYFDYLTKPVIDRLTDATFYTGAHRERFDTYGLGRGSAGTKDIFLHDGGTLSTSRPNEIYS